jgi:hypothetical protein
MIEKQKVVQMDALYKNLTNKSFKKRSAILLVLADLISMPIIYRLCTDINLFKKYLLVSLKLKIPGIVEVPKHILREFYPLYKSGVLLLLVVFLVYHCVVFFFYQKGSEPCRVYTHFYSATAAFGSAFLLYSIIGNDLVNSIAILISSLFYFYNGFAPKELKAKIAV